MYEAQWSRGARLAYPTVTNPVQSYSFVGKNSGLTKMTLYADKSLLNITNLTWKQSRIRNSMWVLVHIFLKRRASKGAGNCGKTTCVKKSHNFRDNPTSIFSIFYSCIHHGDVLRARGLAPSVRPLFPPTRPHPTRRAGLLKLPTGWIL